jgi:hypothetical protein
MPYSPVPISGVSAASSMKATTANSVNPTTAYRRRDLALNPEEKATDSSAAVSGRTENRVGRLAVKTYAAAPTSSGLSRMSIWTEPQVTQVRLPRPAIDPASASYLCRPLRQGCAVAIRSPPNSFA